MSQTQSYSDERWNELKLVIRQIYIEQNKTLQVLRQELARDHNFHPSLNKLKTTLKQWKYSKYSKSSEWRALDLNLKRKGVDIESTQIELDGRPVSLKKLRKELRRYGHSEVEDDITEIPSLANINLKLQPLNQRKPQKPTSTSHPIFELLDMLLPMMSRCQNNGSVPVTTGRSTQLLTMYARLRTCLIDLSCGFHHRRVNSHSDDTDDESQQLLKECLEEASGFDFSKDSGSSQTVEAYFPIFDSSSSSSWDDDLDMAGATELRSTAVIFCVFYLQLNGLLRDSFDKFVAWAWRTESTVSHINQMISRETHCMRCLKSAILHSAIRLNDSVLAAGLLDVDFPQMGHIRVEGPYAPSYKLGSPLQAALVLGNDQLAEILIHMGADVNAIHPCEKQTNRHGFLLQRPANIAARNKTTTGLIPLLIRQYNAKFDVAGLLLQTLLTASDPKLSDSIVQLCLHTVDTTGSNDVAMAMLGAACVNGDTRRAEQALHLGADPNSEVPDFDMIELERELRPQLIGQSRFPISIAMRFNRADVVRVLLTYSEAQGYSVGGDRTFSMILEAVQQSKYDMVVILLLDYEPVMGFAEIKCLCESAIIESDLAILKLLLPRVRSFWPKHLDALSRDLVETAARLGKPEMLQALLGADGPRRLLAVQFQIETIRKALLAAVRSNATNVMQLLMKYATELSAVDADTAAALMDVAVSNRNWKVVRLLHDLRVGIPQIKGYAPFHEAFTDAVRTGDSTVVKMVLKRAPDSCRLNTTQVRDLLLNAAVAGNQIETARALIEAGASPDRYTDCSDHGEDSEIDCISPPVFSAIENKNLDMLQLLVTNGAKLNVTKGGKPEYSDPSVDLNPLEYAIFCGFIDGATMLMGRPDCPVIRDILDFIWDEIQYKPIPHSPLVGDWFLQLPGMIQRTKQEPVLTWCAIEENWPLLEFALREGASVTAESYRGTPLTLVISQRKFVYVERLLRMGASVDVWSENTGRTALMEACQQGHVSSIQLLLKHSADVNLGCRGDTALDIAVRRNPSYARDTALDVAVRRGFLAIVDILLKAGAHIRDPDHDYEGTIAVAAREGRVDVLSLLLDKHIGGATEAEVLAKAKAAATDSCQVNILDFLQDRTWSAAGRSKSTDSES